MIENVTFHLAPEADERAFLEADYRVQTEFAPFQPGFARRTTARGENGEWLVVSLWSSDAAAIAAHDAGASDPAVAEFMALIDPSTIEVRRYTPLEG